MIYVLILIQILGLLYLAWPKKDRIISMGSFNIVIEPPDTIVLLWVAVSLYITRFIFSLNPNINVDGPINLIGFCIGMSIFCIIILVHLIKLIINLIDEFLDIKDIAWIILFGSFIVEYIIRGIQ